MQVNRKLTCRLRARFKKAAKLSGRPERWGNSCSVSRCLKSPGETQGLKSAAFEGAEFLARRLPRFGPLYDPPCVPALNIDLNESRTDLIRTLPAVLPNPANHN